MIPARGGSVGVPRKNVRNLGGQPLISWSIQNALQATDVDHIVVVTDDEEIAVIAQGFKVRVLREEKTTGKATLDDVAAKVVDFIISLGAKPQDVLATVQPTSPFMSADRITEAAEKFQHGAGCVLTVVDDRHLTWTISDGVPVKEYTARVNRQMLPPRYRETGGVIATTIGNFLANKTRIVEPIELIVVGTDEALDIDTFDDWMIAEYHVSRLRILIRVDAGVNLGMGHVYRALALAQELAQHRVTIVISSDHPLSAQFFVQHPFEVFTVDSDTEFIEYVNLQNPDLVILDQLDTDREYVSAIKQHSGSVVTFEDLGTGALEADLLVSDLYTNPLVEDEKQLNGLRNAILSPAFNSTISPITFNAEVKNILVVFGGTDPSGLADKSLKALGELNFTGNVIVVRGLGASEIQPLETYGLRGEILHNVSHMPSIMSRVDLAISSAGRTITELLSLGIPVVCLCQNNKEITHTHASVEFGVINLGLGQLCNVSTLAENLQHLINDPELRRTLHERALRETTGRSNHAVIERILETVKSAH